MWLRQMLTGLVFCTLFAMCYCRLGSERVARGGLPCCFAQPAFQSSVIKASGWLLSEGCFQRGFVKFIITQQANKTWWSDSKNGGKTPPGRTCYAGNRSGLKSFSLSSIFPKSHCSLFQKFSLKDIDIYQSSGLLGVLQ